MYKFTHINDRLPIAHRTSNSMHIVPAILCTSQTAADIVYILFKLFNYVERKRTSTV